MEIPAKRKKIASNESHKGRLSIADGMTCFATIVYLLCLAFFLGHAQKSFGVPISFLKNPTGNMRDVHWQILENSRFQIYYPQGAEATARYALLSLQQGYPDISRRLGVCIKNPTKQADFKEDPDQRCLIQSPFHKVTMILADRYESGGFANPISQNIEISMLYPKQKSFFQHELVHRLMYEHYDFHIGPLGRVFSLAMMPTWWIEGLAEYFTESVGTVETDGFERSMALGHTPWPTWERLHALYHSGGDVTVRGYVTSGRFMGWIFNHSPEKDLYQIHKQISRQTVIPPFYLAVNSWLKENLGATGKELYEKFKQERKEYWEHYLDQMPRLLDSKIESSLVLSEEKSADHSVREIISSQKWIIRDGYVLKDGSLRLLVVWDRALAVMDYDLKAKQVRNVSAFPEWVSRIGPDKKSDRYFVASVYGKSKYELYRIDSLKLKRDFSRWKETQKGTVFDSESSIRKSEALFQTTADSHDQIQNVSNKSKETNGPAPYDNVFLFAYPYALPDFLGGPSVNLIAIPLEDKMERYRIQISGGYHFYLHAPNGSISYINNRFLDLFSVSLFAKPLFNGFYDALQTSNGSTNVTRSYNYLQQIGGSVLGRWDFRPSSFSLRGIWSLSQLQPYESLGAIPTSIGVQYALLSTEKLDLAFTLLQKKFHLNSSDELSSRHLIWKVTTDLGAGKFNSLGKAMDSAGNDAGSLDYYNLNAALNSTFSAYDQNLSLGGRLSTTQGGGTLNLKEFYSPYQTYILGTDTPFNYISYPILNNSSLFDLEMGYWSYSASATYDFPIYPNFESLFLMSYVNRWRGSLGVTEGGVFTTTNWASHTENTSLNIGTNVTVDIKGFQIYPALIYSVLLGNGGWSLLMQVKLMDIL